MSTVELQGREEAAERRRQSRALEMGAHVSITSYATRTRRKEDAMGKEGCHRQPGVVILAGNAWHARPEGKRLLWAQRWVSQGRWTWGGGGRGVLAL